MTRYQVIAGDSLVEYDTRREAEREYDYIAPMPARIERVRGLTHQGEMRCVRFLLKQCF